MVSDDALRVKLENKVFTPYGKTVTWKQATKVLNSRGELSSTSYASSTTIIVPYNIIDKSQSYEKFGTLNSGEMDAAVRYTIAVDIDDQFVIESENWIVKNVEKNYLPDNVVTIVRLAKEQN